MRSSTMNDNDDDFDLLLQYWQETQNAQNAHKHLLRRVAVAAATEQRILHIGSIPHWEKYRQTAMGSEEQGVQDEEKR